MKTFKTNKDYKDFQEQKIQTAIKAVLDVIDRFGHDAGPDNMFELLDDPDCKPSDLAGVKSRVEKHVRKIFE